MYYLFALLFPMILLLPSRQVTVSVTSTEAGGELRLAVFPDAEAFQDDRDLVGIVNRIEGNRTTVSLVLPGPGRYVFAAFQDLNGNGKLDRNFWGVPTEPYGFTRSPTTKWRAPSFEEVASEVREGQPPLVLELRRWSEY